jgi:hypothetical protein
MNHPYLEVLQNTLAVHKKMLDCLEKRLVLVHIDYALKNEYEKNEIEIVKIKTQGEIDALKKVIKMREEYFINYMKNFAIEMEECEKEYESTLSKAKLNSKVSPILDTVNWIAVKENIQIKVKLYQRLKDLLK